MSWLFVHHFVVWIDHRSLGRVTAEHPVLNMICWSSVVGRSVIEWTTVVCNCFLCFNILFSSASAICFMSYGRVPSLSHRLDCFISTSTGLVPICFLGLVPICFLVSLYMFLIWHATTLHWFRNWFNICYFYSLILCWSTRSILFVTIWRTMTYLFQC